jgi:hypothetical protein
MRSGSIVSRVRSTASQYASSGGRVDRPSKQQTVARSGMLPSRHLTLQAMARLLARRLVCDWRDVETEDRPVGNVYPSPRQSANCSAMCR